MLIMTQKLNRKPISEETKLKISNTLKGRKLPIETREKMSLAKRGKSPPNLGISFGFKGRQVSNDTRQKISEANIGEKHPRFGKAPWNKGIGTKATESKKFRSSKEYSDFRKSCFARDNYTCVLCNKFSGVLNMDHIKPFSMYPELRMVLDNVRTLCHECHKKTDTYGYKSVLLKKQLTEDLGL